MKNFRKTRHSRRDGISSRLFEQLESRVLLSANIVASVSNGILSLQDNGGNCSVVVDQTSLTTTQFRVTSGDGTTKINNQTGPQIFSGVNSLTIKAGSGNDIVVIMNSTVTNNVQITGTSGNQVVTLDTIAIGGNFTLTNSGAQNSTKLKTCTIAGNVTVNAGAGFTGQCGTWWSAPVFSDANEIFTLSATSTVGKTGTDSKGNTTVSGGNVTITNTSGQTTTDIETSTIRNSISVTNGASSYGNCFFHHSSAAPAGDLFNMSSSTVGTAITYSNGTAAYIGGNVTVSNASDGNTTDIENTTILGNLSVSNVVGTSEQYGFCSTNTANLADASDAFIFLGSSVGTFGATASGNVTLYNISDGASADIEGATILGSLTINNGVGSYTQGFTACAGQSSADIGDLLTLATSSVVNNVSIINGSTFNSTDLEVAFVGGNLTISNGMNYASQSSGGSCGGGSYSNNSYGGSSYDNNSWGGSSYGNNSCGGNSYTYTSCGSSSYGNNYCGGNSYGYTSCGGYQSCGGKSGGNNYKSVYTTDLVTLFASVIGNNISVINASGYTNTSLFASVIGNNATFTNANGIAIFDLTSSIIGWNLSFVAGTGSTNVTISDSLVGNNANISAGAGSTTIAVSNSTISNNANISTVTRASISIDPSQVDGRLTVRG